MHKSKCLIGENPKSAKNQWLVLTNVSKGGFKELHLSNRKQGAT